MVAARVPRVRVQRGHFFPGLYEKLETEEKTITAQSFARLADIFRVRFAGLDKLICFSSTTGGASALEFGNGLENVITTVPWL